MMFKTRSAQKRSAWMLLAIMVTNCLLPLRTFALTGGPTQPEVQSFEPVGTSEMVELSSGGFNYNIPLFEVGGYPLNLAYHAGATMDEEASVCGLGWNINPGAIIRNMRGLPDDFNGEQVTKELSMKPDITVGSSGGIKLELFGLDNLKLSANAGVRVNSYTGIGFEFGVSPEISIAKENSPGLTAGIGIGADSEDGSTATPYLSYDIKLAETSSHDVDLGISASASFHTRGGLMAASIGPELKLTPVSNMSVTENPDGSVTYKRGDNAERSAGSSSVADLSYSFNFAKPTFVPQIQFPRLNSSFAFTGTVGSEIYGTHASFWLRGYGSTQRLLTSTLNPPAYGVLYAENGAGNSNAMLDFNREKDLGVFHKEIPNLPLPIRTQDVYSVLGQGIGGSYQLKRGDVGVVFDPESFNLNIGGTVGAELGLGNTGHGGGDFHSVFFHAKTGAWTENNLASTNLNFVPKAVNNNHYEPAYFKVAGDMSVETDSKLSEKIGAQRPVRVAMSTPGGSSMKVKAEQKLVENKDSETGFDISKPVKREKRERRNQAISYLNAMETEAFGVDPGKIIDYPFNSFVNATPTPVSRTDGNRKAHHIGEMTVLREDGLRYVYGLPAYNNTQVEVSFNVSGNALSQSGDGLVTYTPGADDTKGNQNGLDHYYSKTVLPAYAHSYLLTAVLSQDYVDVTGDGLTDDDYGAYTKFNYHKAHSDYNWRIPVEENMANYDPGLRVNNSDDKGSYVYGKKEIWYIHSIESKTQVAEFYYNKTDRKDSYGVSGPEGGADSNQKLYYLEKIVLYSKPDRVKNGTDAVPIKTVHFRYDYQLCPGLPNSDGQIGKLTLIELWFTYGKSGKGKLSPYKFSYNSSSSATYNIKAYNRWGSYKPNVSVKGSPIPDNVDFPYVNQPGFYGSTEQILNEEAGIWNLKQIVLPSGGKINIEYEAHTYAYVQDKRAMQMFPIEGIGDVGADNLYGNLNIPNDNWLIFRLSEPLPASLPAGIADNFVRNYYLGDILTDKDKFLYFKCRVDLNSNKEYDYVSGYSRIKTGGAYAKPGASTYEYGYVELEKVSVKDKGPKDINPIAKAAWQFARLNQPDLVYGKSNVNATSSPDEQVLNSLVKLASDFKANFSGGVNEYLKDKGHGKVIDLTRSWIRLNNPTRKKFAGGYRVKRITIEDSWSGMTGGVHASATYGQEYDYTTHEFQPDGNYTEISSGVAAYEPMIGNDENPFRQPVFFNEKNILAPDNKHYLEKPFGESLFPVPSIVYSRVTVKNIKPANADVTRNSTGKIVHEYYTAKDFPTITRQTGLGAIPKKTNPVLKILGFKHSDFEYYSQGYVVKLNNMHGKPKAQWIFDENGTQLSGIEYRYKLTTQGELNNNATVIMPDGSVDYNAILGLEYDMIADSRNAQTETISAGVSINLDLFLVGIFPVPVPMILPKATNQKTGFSSMCLTKVIHQYGILERTIAWDMGATVQTENLAFDAETGEALLTRTTNEFVDSIYSLKFPAHWAEEGMQAAYQNLGANFDFMVSQGHAYPSSTQMDFITKGDEVIVGGQRGWVIHVSKGNKQIFVADINGNPLSGKFTKIVRSGHRNLQTTEVGSIVSMKNPMKGNDLDFTNIEVINASAVRYSDDWQSFCGYGGVVQDSCACESDLQLDEFKFSFLVFLKHLKDNNLLLTNGSIEKIDPYPAGFTNILNKIKNQYPALCSNGPGAEFVGFASEIKNGDLVGSFYYGDNSQISNPACKIPCFTITNFGHILTDPNLSIRTINNLVYNKYACQNNQFCVDIQFKEGLPITFCGASSCFDFFKNCSGGNSQWACGPVPGMIANPYTRGIWGTWRPDTSFTYLTTREQNIADAAGLPTSGSTNIRRDGYFNMFTPYYKPPVNASQTTWSTDNKNWTWTAEATQYNPMGNQIESKDALGIYSAELLGYKNQLVVATAANARYRQMAFDGFEDYEYVNFSGTCPTKQHFGFGQDGKNLLSQTESHSGKYSLLLSPGKKIGVEYQVVDLCPGKKNTPPFDAYRLQPCDCIQSFSPDPGKYVFSAWIKEVYSAGTGGMDYKKAFYRVTVDGKVQDFFGAGQPIEGWQRVYGEFEIPSGAKSIKVECITIPVPHVLTYQAYFDDIRLHPFEAGFKSFVYDDINLRFTYELDDNNYFTKYEYDQSGMLERVKKETERGVMTIQESRFGQQKKQ